VIADDGAQLGIMSTWDALSLARDRGVDLIEVSPNAVPPVCRLDDYGRLRYEQNKKDKEARKKAHNMELREVKLRPKIEEHDYQVKFRTAERLLYDGDKVKVTIMFRGREIAYAQHGRRLLERVAADTAKFANVEREPRLEGRNMFMILSPKQDIIAALHAHKAAPAAKKPVQAGGAATNPSAPATPAKSN
jgi:translation initiation factor IF-3